MSRLQILSFCGACLAVALGTAMVLFPYATLPQDTLAQAHTPQPMEALPDIDLGPNFGPVPVTELVGYWMDNPPQPQTGGVARHVEQFGGC